MRENDSLNVQNASVQNPYIEVLDAVQLLADKVNNDTNAKVPPNDECGGLTKLEADFRDGVYSGIPEEVYQKLPKWIIKFLKNYEPGPIRDTVTLALLALLSGCCHSIAGYYHNVKYRPNIFIFIIGEPASGKGVVNILQIPLKKIHKYNIEIDSNFKFHIPGNNSRAMLVHRLSLNNGSGYIIETEGDAIANNWKSEWGNLSAELRMIFQNEPIMFERLRDNTYIRVECPKMALTVTLTPSQLPNLVNERNNGLYSRLGIYRLSSDLKFKDPSTPVDNNIITSAETLSDELLEWYKGIYNRELIFKLSDTQWASFNEFWNCRFDYLLAEYGTQDTDLVFRHALMSFKIAMVLAALNIDSTYDLPVFSCSDNYLDAALKITETLLYHSKATAELYSTNEINANPVAINILKTINQETFTSRLFIETAVKIPVSNRTAKRYLAQLVTSGIIIKLKHSLYKKVNK